MPATSKALAAGTSFMSAILGTGGNRENEDSLQILGAKGGTRTPTGFPARS